MTPNQWIVADAPAGQAFQAERWKNLAFNALPLAAIALVLFLRYPYPPLVVLHLVLPWISLALVGLYPALFTLSWVKKGSYRKGLTIGWMWLGVCSLLVYDTTKLVVWQRSLTLGCLAGAAFLLISLMVHQRCGDRFTAVGVIFLALFSAAYGYGAVREVNILLDRSPGTVHESVVLQKHYSSGRGGSSYYLAFVPWTSTGDSETINVTSALYHSIKVRERICIVSKNGALGMAWYTAQACPWNGKIEFP